MLASAVFVSIAQPARAVDERIVMTGADLVRMIGVCVHMPYNDGAYANLQNVLADLKYLGVKGVRDGIPKTDSVPSMLARDALRRMAFDGIKFDLIFQAGFGVREAISYLQTLEKAVSGSVAYVEGYNEINNFPVTFEGQAGPNAALAGQRAIYQALKADDRLKTVPVIDMTGFEMVKEPGFAYGDTLSGFADVMNIHFYAQNGDQPGRGIQPGKPSNYASMRENLPKVITEFGYATRPESGWLVIGVDERTQAKGILNGLFDAARSGYDRVYIYELLDEKADPNNSELQFHFGLFTFENRPKIAAQTIRNLTAILAERGGGPAPGRGSAATPTQVQVGPVESADPIQSLTVVRAGGDPILALWHEPRFWDRAKGSPIEASPLPVSVTFAASCASVKIYDPLLSDQPVSTHGNGPISVMLEDHVKLIECAS
jgi:hypothetical protein